MRSFNTVSVPGKRVYYSLNNLSLLNNAICGNSFYIISTNNGLLDSRESLTIRNIAGEIYIKVDI
jgi:ribosomal protein S8